MATGETGFDDVTFDLISVQYHALKAGHDYGQYVRDAKNAGESEIASFFEEVMEQDSQRAHRCHEFLARLGGTDNTSPQGSPATRTPNQPRGRRRAVAGCPPRRRGGAGRTSRGRGPASGTPTAGS